MTGKYVLIDGEPMEMDDLLLWAAWFEEAAMTGERILKQEFIGPLFISTVFLGLDHNWAGGPPILWETMIFVPDGDWHDSYQERYHTKAEALEGHQRAVVAAQAAEAIGGDPESMMAAFKAAFD